MVVVTLLTLFCVPGFCVSMMECGECEADHGVTRMPGRRSQRPKLAEGVASVRIAGESASWVMGTA